MRSVLVSVLLAAASLAAQDSRDLLNRGVQEFRSGNYPAAVATFQQAVDADPAFTTARLYLATAYMQQYIPGVQSAENAAFARNAQAQFLAVLDRDPANRVALESLGSLNLNQKNWDEALKWFQKLTAVDPGNAGAWYSMGFIAWSEWYPAYMTARQSLGMRPETPGPLPAGSVKDDLRARYSSVIEGGLQALRQGLLINPKYSDAMAYVNLLIRERADLRDDPSAYQHDIQEADQWVNKALEAKKQQVAEQTGAVAPPPPPPPGSQGATPSRIRVGGKIQQANRLSSVPPVYPELAKQARVQGTVQLEVVIDKQGNVATVNPIEGPPLLVQAAIDAVRQWTYRPTLLNGEPVEVVTTVDVNFTLNQ